LNGDPSPFLHRTDIPASIYVNPRRGLNV